MDMISDIAMIIQYFEEGNDFYANMLLISIVLNLGLQICTVSILHKKKSTSNILCEVLGVVLCIKPAIDAARVASGKEQQPDELVDSMSELT